MDCYLSDFFHVSIEETFKQMGNFTVYIFSHFPSDNLSIIICRLEIINEVVLCLLLHFFPQCLPYSLLLQQLELKNVRELEDLLIEAVYCDIIQGKLDQRNQQVEVDCSVGRDLGPNELPNIINTLQEWWVLLVYIPIQDLFQFSQT